MDDLFLRNRRRHYRRAVEADSQLRARMLLGGHWHDTVVLDTSAGGIGLAVAPELTPARGAALELELHAQALPAPVRAPGILRYVEEEPGHEGRRLGIELQDLETFYTQIVPGLLAQFNRRVVQRLDTRAEHLELEVRFGGVRGRGRVQDLSTWGVCVIIGPAMPEPHIDTPVELLGALPGDEGYPFHLVARVRHQSRSDDCTRLGLAIDRQATPDFHGAEAALAMYAIRFQRDRARR